MSPRHSRLAFFAAIVLLLLLAYLQLSTLAITSPTMDELLHIARGYAYVVRGEERILLRGPVLSNALSGLALLIEPKLVLPPPDDPMWLDSEAADLSDTFVWSNTVSPFEIVFLARLPIILVSWLAGALVYRWAFERSGPLPALGALLLYVFCPNLLAHARLATTDVVTAATFLIGAYAFHRALVTPQRVPRLLSGIAFGLALAAKVSSGVLIPAFLLQAAIQAWQNRAHRKQVWEPIVTTLVTFGLGGTTLWAIYRFRFGPVEPGGIPLPAPYYWAEWVALSKYLPNPPPGYLFGEISPHGWWYYYPLAFVFKTPLPVILLTLAALLSLVRLRSWSSGMSVWLVPGLYFAGLLTSPHAIGYRYLLPILPLIFVGCAEVIAAALQTRWLRIAVGLLLLWYVAGTLNIYPYYLAYFNELAGGPVRGRYILSDSNVDWGQDLVGLKQYVDEHHIDRIKLSYFGVAHPSAYGLNTEALPPVRTAMRDQGAWWLHTYYPPDPGPGLYAVSVSNLMGGQWIDQNTYAYFRDRAPDAMIGYSIYIYTIPPRGAPASLSLSGLQIDQIDPVTYRLFETNDVRPRWFDATSSLIAAPGQTWIAIADDQALAPELAPLIERVEPATRAVTTDDRRPYALYHFELAERISQAAQQSEQIAQEVKLPIQFGETAELIGYTLTRSDPTTTLVTYWRAGKHIVTPLQLFVHALGPEGQIIAQEDRLDAPAFGWREGDLIAQVNRLTLPAGTGRIWIQVGLYNAETGERLPVNASDRPVGRQLLLKQMTR